MATEWHQVNYLCAGNYNRRIPAAFLMTLAIAALDTGWTRMNFSVLYIVPLALLASADALRPLWHTVSLLAGITVAAYFIKHTIYPRPYFEFFSLPALTNRALVVVLIVIVGKILQAGFVEREQSDIELPDSFRAQENESNSTLAIIWSLFWVAAIAVADFALPATTTFRSCTWFRCSLAAAPRPTLGLGDPCSRVAPFDCRGRMGSSTLNTVADALP